nr:MAG TPA: hypothetical protein [Microviridae sp.]
MFSQFMKSTLLPEGNRCYLHRFNFLVLTMQK